MDLGSWGQLEVVDRQHLAVRTGVDRREIEVNGLLDGAANMVGWFNPDTAIVLLAGKGEHIVRLDLTLDVAESVAKLAREEDEDLRHLSFHVVDGAVICLLEHGVVCFDLGGTLRWQVTHDDVSAEFTGVREGAVWFASQWPPDRVGYRFAFRLNDGIKILG
jgi:hypothetical protein